MCFQSIAASKSFCDRFCVRDGGELVVTMNLPGFDRKDIKLHLHANVLSVRAEKPEDQEGGSVVCSQRPYVIEKGARLPARIR